MSFWGIVGLVLLAVIALSMLFAFFHIFFMLLPAIIVIALVIWLINHFTKKDDIPNTPSSGSSSWYDWRSDNNTQTKRKKARNVKTKDVDK
ncbi:hypothetical protein OZY43_02985 [Lactobacillus sp. ESL0785]|uniref:hypothetical protein n=1 Tax=Lactobacillus sp. ESL0785 TaxID=2983232 RepID=UPI0023F8A0C2|nr:hypothetical protein [Lactobacillus sp. ESL0785]WEV71382.1 hypothetical protein OZY43_02985 [Lactobacillus sp. ESL0785]